MCDFQDFDFTHDLAKFTFRSTGTHLHLHSQMSTPTFSVEKTWVSFLLNNKIHSHGQILVRKVCIMQVLKWIVTTRDLLRRHGRSLQEGPNTPSSQGTLLAAAANTEVARGKITLGGCKKMAFSGLSGCGILRRHSLIFLGGC